MNGTARTHALDLDTADGVAELETRIRTRLGGQLPQFRVEVSRAGVVLRGRARTYYAKQIAQHAVMEASDRPILANDLEVC